MLRVLLRLRVFVLIASVLMMQKPLPVGPGCDGTKKATPPPTLRLTSAPTLTELFG